eukprot:scaffold567048_cov23-Prasinocladus_malaysianus.AAC.1
MNASLFAWDTLEESLCMAYGIGTILNLLYVIPRTRGKDPKQRARAKCVVRHEVGGHDQNAVQQKGPDDAIVQPKNSLVRVFKRRGLLEVAPEGSVVGNRHP